MSTGLGSQLGLVKVMRGDLIWRSAVKVKWPASYSGVFLVGGGCREWVCRGDESQAWRRSVCGQNKMYPVFKGVFKQPIWGWNCGWVNSTSETPLWLHIKLFHTIKSAHTHTHHTHFLLVCRATGGDIIPTGIHRLMLLLLLQKTLLQQK